MTNRVFSIAWKQQSVHKNRTFTGWAEGEVRSARFASRSPNCTEKSWREHNNKFLSQARLRVVTEKANPDLGEGGTEPFLGPCLGLSGSELATTASCLERRQEVPPVSVCSGLSTARPPRSPSRCLQSRGACATEKAHTCTIPRMTSVGRGKAIRPEASMTVHGMMAGGARLEQKTGGRAPGSRVTGAKALWQ